MILSLGEKGILSFTFLFHFLILPIYEWFSLQMQTWVVICWGILALVGADECPDGGRCEEGHTCCSSPTNGYGCCPFDQVDVVAHHVFLNIFV